MKTERNDPCPCGSGRKYKKCCMSKDLEARRASQSAQEPQPPPPDPHIEVLNARWEEFEAEDYEGQIALFQEALDEPELMDGEMAIEMLAALHKLSIERGDREGFDALIGELRERLPGVYHEKAPYFLDWQIKNAAARGRWDVVSEGAREFATRADDDIDIFNHVLDMLAYHGRLSLLVEVTGTAWSSIQGSASIVPWGIDEFSQRTADYIVFDHLERHLTLDLHDAQLQEQLCIYVSLDPESFSRYIAHLTGRGERRWTIGDFRFQSQCEPTWTDVEEVDEADWSPDSGRQNLYDLTVEFLGYLRREEGVPYSKGELAREQIFQYILFRVDGKLERRESLFEEMMRSPQTSQAQTQAPPPDHRLCPDRGTLERFLVPMLDLLSFGFPRYRAATTFELVPAWLRFLESKQLIDARQREKTLLELKGLDTELLKIWNRYPDDPALQREMEHWREQQA